MHIKSNSRAKGIQILCQDHGKGKARRVPTLSIPWKEVPKRNESLVTASSSCCCCALKSGKNPCPCMKEDKAGVYRVGSTWMPGVNAPYLLSPSSIRLAAGKWRTHSFCKTRIQHWVKDQQQANSHNQTDLYSPAQPAQAFTHISSSPAQKSAGSGMLRQGNGMAGGTERRLQLPPSWSRCTRWADEERRGNFLVFAKHQPLGWQSLHEAGILWVCLGLLYRVGRRPQQPAHLWFSTWFYQDSSKTR